MSRHEDAPEEPVEEGVTPRERPRVVRLVVVQSDVEKAEDDAVHEANPRPRVRGDCGPLACPHCGKQVLMRLGISSCCTECGDACEVDGRGVAYHLDADGEVDWAADRGHVAVPEEELMISCPECKGEVETSWGLEEWVPAGEGDGLDPRPSMLNHCRPCPWVGCVHHLHLDVMDSGQSIRMNFPSKEPEELDETCSLDVAERDGITLDEVGKTINITRERVRQLIEQALKACRKNTNTMFKTSIDLEDVNELRGTTHPLEEAE